LWILGNVEDLLKLMGKFKGSHDLDHYAMRT
jgi:hypothetical protein